MPQECVLNEMLYKMSNLIEKWNWKYFVRSMYLYIMSYEVGKSHPKEFPFCIGPTFHVSLIN